jgi:hypothetical protein
MTRAKLGKFDLQHKETPGAEDEEWRVLECLETSGFALRAALGRKWCGHANIRDHEAYRHQETDVAKSSCKSNLLNKTRH